MLKAPPVNPRTYDSRASIIDPTEGRYYVPKYVRKSFKTSERGQQCYLPNKKGYLKMPFHLCTLIYSCAYSHYDYYYSVPLHYLNKEHEITLCKFLSEEVVLLFEQL